MKTHQPTRRVRRTRQRLRANGSIESDPAIEPRAERVRSRAGSLPIESYRYPLRIRSRHGISSIIAATYRASHCWHPPRPHEITGLIGAGGMGEVFQAQDTKLKRRVAIKVLPEAFAANPDRVARFHREAQAVAALNHPGIAAIYDLAEAGGTTFLVLELIEGETLAQRLARGPLAVDEAVGIARQILDALEAAHEKGICHRDLKPANVALTRDGAVKVLDFGLAKFLQDRGTEGNLTDLSTTFGGTSAGVVLGTAGYMSPEQAKGLEADQRSDIFSFGCIFYELLSGRRAFEGDTPSEQLANVLKSDVDLSRLPPTLNSRLVEVLVCCLEKNPKQRWHAAADVRLLLEGIADLSSAAEDSRAAAAGARPPWKWAVAVAAIALVGALAAAYGAWRLKPEPPRAVTRFSIPLPEGQQFSNVGRPILALSPDGTNLVYVANRRLYLRPMSGYESRPIAGSEHPGAVLNPVFSPDGQSVAFASVDDAALKRLPISGGAPVTICKIEALFGLSWSEDGIVFGQPKGILRVSPDGGTPEVIASAAADEMVEAPQMLPGGRAVLFSVKKSADGWDKGQIVVQNLGGGARKTVIDGGAAGMYVPTGHLVYAVSTVLFAVPFNLDSLTVSGGAVSIVEGVLRGRVEGRGPNRAGHRPLRLFGDRLARLHPWAIGDRVDRGPRPGAVRSESRGAAARTAAGALRRAACVSRRQVGRLRARGRQRRGHLAVRAVRHQRDSAPDLRREEPCARMGRRFPMDRLPVRSGRRRRDLPPAR